MALRKLTLSVDEIAIEKARQYSAARDISISKLVGGFLAALPGATGPLSPKVQSLIGVIPSDSDLGEYRQHLDEKHGR
jgi:hypothetical protein